MAFIVALDQGTTSSRAIVFDAEGKIHAVGQQEFPQLYPEPGWVEHDPVAIWKSQSVALEQALSSAQLSARDIAGIGITNQRETTLLWDRRTGEPLHNAIVWQDRRTASLCHQLKSEGKEPLFTERTGLVLDPYFSGTKLRWLLDAIPGARDRAVRNELAFGTVESYLLWKLSNGQCHVTDVANASRTLLLNIHTGQWDPELLEILDIPPSVLPTIVSNSDVYTEVATGHPLQGVPIAGMAGDQQAALFGQTCFSPGMAKNTYGTGCFLLMNTGTEPQPSRCQLLTTVAWRYRGLTEYALEGSVFIAGAVVQWLRDGLGIIRHSSDVEPLAQTVPDNGGVVVVPAFAGLGAPYWDAHARGTIVGLTRGSTAGHIARAALESIAFQSVDVLKAMEQDSGTPLQELRVDGGASRNDLLMQFQADMLQIPVVRPTVTETTALGAAYLAGLAVAFWKDRDEIAQQWHVDRRFEPQMPTSTVESLYGRWKEAVSRSRAWSES